MQDNSFFRRNPDAKEFFRLLLHELEQRQKPPDQIIMSDEDVMEELGISKRRVQYMRSNGIIPSRKVDPASPRTYCFLSDILDQLKKNTIDSFDSKLKIK